ncbi:MAG: glycosyltransferase [Thermoplasmata archaeon]|nr:glycosyltransferase [Thermoplasmata archaeon]
MWIQQVAPFFHPHVGGVESHVRDISIELIRRGHEVEVLTPRYDPALPESDVHMGVPIRRSRMLFSAFSTPCSPAIRKDIDPRADIVHVHTPPPLTEYFAVRGSLHLGKPVVLTHHCDLEIPSCLGPLITGVYRRTLGRSAISKADRLVVTTRSYAATSRYVWRYRPTVVPNTVDIHRFRPDIDGEAVRMREGIGRGKVAMYVGRIVFHKGLEYFIRSAMHTGDDVLHLIIGSGPKTEELKALARRTGVADKVHFRGYVSDEELPQFYAAADVLVLPSVSRLEAFGIVGLEAMASGKPVVLSNIPGVRDVITHGEEGFLADPMDPLDLGRKISSIMEDPVAASEMGRKGRQHVVDKYSLKGVGDILAPLYRDVLRDHRRRSALHGGRRRRRTAAGQRSPRPDAP